MAYTKKKAQKRYSVFDNYISSDILQIPLVMLQN
jgi:hypothetical protein